MPVSPNLKAPPQMYGVEHTSAPAIAPRRIIKGGPLLAASPGVRDADPSTEAGRCEFLLKGERLTALTKNSAQR